MVYSNGVIPLTLLLSAGSVTVSAAATIPWDGGRDLSIHLVSSLLPPWAYRSTLILTCCLLLKSGRDATPRYSTSPSTIQRGVFRSSRGLTISRSMAELFDTSSDDAGSPIRITTTEEVSRMKPLSQSSEISGLGVPNGTSDVEVMSTTKAKSNSQLDPKKLIHGGIQGFLDIVATTDEDPKTLRIASLGFPNDNIGDNPFEIGSESEDGSIVYLVPTKPSDISLVSLAPQTSNDTQAMMFARSSFSDVLPRFNSTSSKPPTANAVSSPITVRLKAAVTDVESQESDELCVTYNNNWDQLQDEPPMRLKHCDDSYIPDSSSSSGNSSETQLWQYDPETRELRPLLLGLATKAAGEDPTNPSAVAPATTSPMTSAAVEVMTFPPLDSSVAGLIVPSTVVGKADSPHGRTGTSTQAATSPSSITRRASDKGRAANKYEDKHVTLGLPKSNDAVQKQDDATRSLMALVPVDPYTLLFSPRSAARRASLVPRPPA